MIVYLFILFVSAHIYAQEENDPPSSHPVLAQILLNNISNELCTPLNNPLPPIKEETQQELEAEEGFSPTHAASSHVFKSNLTSQSTSDVIA